MLNMVFVLPPIHSRYVYSTLLLLEMSAPTYGAKRVAKRPAQRPSRDARDTYQEVASVRDYNDTIKELQDQHPEAGYRVIGDLLRERCKITISYAQLFVIKRIMGSTTRRLQARPSREDYADSVGGLSEYTDTIKTLREEHPEAGYRDIRKLLETRCRVKLSVSQEQSIRRLMASASENYAAVDDVMEYKDTILAVQAEHPDAGYRTLSKLLGERCRIQLSNAQIQTVHRIMHGGAIKRKPAAVDAMPKLSLQELSEPAAADVVQGILSIHSTHKKRKRAVEDHYGRRVDDSVAGAPTTMIGKH